MARTHQRGDCSPGAGWGAAPDFPIVRSGCCGKPAGSVSASSPCSSSWCWSATTRAIPAGRMRSSTRQTGNLGGRVGAWIADFMLYLFGFSAYLFSLFLMMRVLVAATGRCIAILPEEPSPELSRFAVGALGRLRRHADRLHRHRSRAPLHDRRDAAAGARRPVRRAGGAAGARAARCGGRHARPPADDRDRLQPRERRFLADRLRAHRRGDRGFGRPRERPDQRPRGPAPRRARGHQPRAVGGGPAPDHRRRSRAVAHPAAGQGGEVRARPARAPGAAVLRPAGGFGTAAVVAAGPAARDASKRFGRDARIHLAADREEAVGLRRRRPPWSPPIRGR